MPNIHCTAIFNILDPEIIKNVAHVFIMSNLAIHAIW